MCLLDMFQRRQSVDGFPGLLLRHSQFIEPLQVEPKFRTRSEEMSESKCRVTRGRSPAVQNFRDPIGRHIEAPCELSSAHAQLFEFFNKMFPRLSVPHFPGHAATAWDEDPLATVIGDPPISCKPLLAIEYTEISFLFPFETAR